MNPNQIDESLLKYAVGWDGAYLPRALFVLFGALVLVLTVRTAMRRSSPYVAGILWLVIGLSSLAFGAFPQQIIDFIISTEYITRIRGIMWLVSALILFVTLESIRKTHLQERYALLWVATGLVIMVCAMFPQAVNLFRAVTGMQYATAVVAVAFTFLAMVAFHFSIAMSSMQSGQSKLAQKMAILEARVRELEARIEKSGGGRGAGA